MEEGGAVSSSAIDSSHVEHCSYDFADHSMSCLSSPALVDSIRNHPQVDRSPPCPSPSPSPSPVLVREMSPARCRAALTSHKLEWLKQWGRLAELEMKWSTCELIYVGNTNVIQST